MLNYQKSKIYKLFSESHPEIVYYGSTTRSLKKRLSGHQSKTNSCTSKQCFEYDDAKIELVELYPCNEKHELLKRERHYIESNECVNKNIPSKTQQERGKEYKIIYKEKIKKYNTRLIKCECGDKIQYHGLKKHKLSNNHINKMKGTPIKSRKEKMKEYALDNKEYFDTIINRPIECECGVTVAHKNLKRHKLRKIHFNNLEK